MIIDRAHFPFLLGSPLHGVKSLQYPRWEDYIYERLDGDGNNRLYFLGQGDTVADLDPEANSTFLAFAVLHFLTTL